MRPSITAYFAIVISASAVHASNIGFNTIAGGPSARIIATSEGMATTAFVRIGSFTDFASNQSVITGRNFGAIDALFTPIGEAGSPVGGGTGGPLAVGNDGNVAGAITNVTTAAFAGGTQFYAWVVQAPSVAQLNEATEWAIFRDAAWVMPNSDLANATFATFQINEPSEVVSGSLSSDGQIRLEVVPEPSAVGLLALTGFCLLAHRRR